MDMQEKKRNIYNAIQNLYNMDFNTWQEVLAMLYNLVADVDQKFDTFESKFEISLGEEVTLCIKELVNNGTLSDLINNTLLKNLINNVDTFSNNFNLKLTTKAEKVYVDTMIGNMGNTKTFKGRCIYTNLPTIGMKVDDYWYVSDKNTNYCWNGVNWIDIGNNINLGTNTVSPDKTTFLVEVPHTNKLKTTEKSINGNSLWVPIYLEPNTEYHVQHTIGYSGCLIAIYDNIKTNKLITIVNWEVFNGSNGITFTTDYIEKGWYYFRFQIPTDIDIQTNAEKLKNNWLVSKGNVSIKYEDYKPNFILNDDVKIRTENFNNTSVDFSMLKDYGVQNIKFTFTNGITIDELTGTLAPSSIRKGDKEYKKVYPNSRYYVNFPCRIILYNGKNERIEYISKDDILLSGHFFDTPNDCEYVRVNVLNDFINNDTIFILSDKVVALENANKKALNPSLFLQTGIKSIFDGKKMVTDGHSIVAQGLWQNYLTRELGVILHKNCGIGGTTIVSMCSDDRVNQIPEDTELLLLMAETNDFSQNIELGNINSPHDTNTFYGAYQLWLDKIYAKIPNATVILIGSPYKADEDILNTKGLTLNDYRKATKEIAFKYGYHYTDIRGRMGVNHLNYKTFIPDGTHPAMYGAKNMSVIIVGDMKNMSSIDYTIKYK